MALGTFGAVMGFAAELAAQSASFYETAARTAKDSELGTILRSLAEDEKKYCALMERARRENVTEMILAPIEGLDPGAYQVNVGKPDQENDKGILASALLLEEREQRFFGDSAGKIPLPEVARLFRKVAQKKEKSVAKLRSLE
jgi:rubrerythrin